LSKYFNSAESRHEVIFIAVTAKAAGRDVLSTHYTDCNNSTRRICTGVDDIRRRRQPCR